MYGVDFFAGAGGLSLGAELAGIEVFLAIEKDREACETYRINHQSTKLLEEDICSLEELPITEKHRPLIFFGGPPCQGFSTSNQRTRKVNNPNNWLFGEFMRLTAQYSPDVVVLENVKGLQETAKSYFLKLILNELEMLGYYTSFWVVNSVDHGVPQKRDRIFIIGNKKMREVEPPSPTTCQPVTVGNAINDLPFLENGCNKVEMSYRSSPQSIYSEQMRRNSCFSYDNHVTRNAEYIVERYKHIPQGGNWQSIPTELMGNYKKVDNCHTGIYRRLFNEEVSVVIGNYRKNMLIHPFQHRGLSVREAARLQSFPDSFRFRGTIGFQQQQVGNAVPPLLSKAVFKKLIDIGLMGGGG